MIDKSLNETVGGVTVRCESPLLNKIRDIHGEERKVQITVQSEGNRQQYREKEMDFSHA